MLELVVFFNTAGSIFLLGVTWKVKHHHPFENGLGPVVLDMGAAKAKCSAMAWCPWQAKGTLSYHAHRSTRVSNEKLHCAQRHVSRKLSLDVEGFQQVEATRRQFTRNDCLLHLFFPLMQMPSKLRNLYLKTPCHAHCPSRKNPRITYRPSYQPPNYAQIPTPITLNYPVTPQSTSFLTLTYALQPAKHRHQPHQRHACPLHLPSHGAPRIRDRGTRRHRRVRRGGIGFVRGRGTRHLRRISRFGYGGGGNDRLGVDGDEEAGGC